MGYCQVKCPEHIINLRIKETNKITALIKGRPSHVGGMHQWRCDIQ
jgi:hypothetical protein